MVQVFVIFAIYYKVMAAEYHFITEWRFKADIRDVARVLEDVESLSTWWPTVYLDVKVVNQGGDKGIGRKVELSRRATSLTSCAGTLWSPSLTRLMASLWKPVATL